MTRALELAHRGQGRVEPNPMVGCVIVRDGKIVGEGWHQRYGGPHAEPEALCAAGEAARGSTLYVTLEPCCHQGKTAPCSAAVIAAGIKRVVAALQDPFPQVAGGGFRQLRAAGVEVQVGVLQDEARDLIAPYYKLVSAARPWVHAKWAMTWDGKLATHSGDSRWISNETSRGVVHQLRGRVDAILVGRGTAEADDPLLTARPPGPRTATRVVLDSRAALAVDSQLVRTARQIPVLVVVGHSAPTAACQRLEAAGCEILKTAGEEAIADIGQLLDELGRRRMTNVLVEGGSTLLGTLFDAGEIDEVHAFVAAKLVGGAQALHPIGGAGVDRIATALTIDRPQIEILDGDVYLRGRILRT
jgi:diaminohydroxyphosphoribosylaminopyrimidine deaminase/5-amino-6-(5-phosphoribosylamino)uracil reductase